MKRKTFRQLYDEASALPRAKTPAQIFVDEVAAATGRNPITVRLWLTGRQVPHPRTIKAIADRFNVDPFYLFPEQDNDTGT